MLRVGELKGGSVCKRKKKIKYAYIYVHIYVPAIWPNVPPPRGETVTAARTYTHGMWAWGTYKKGTARKCNAELHMALRTCVDVPPAASLLAQTFSRHPKG